MIRAVMYEDQAGQWAGFSVKGHSGYAEAGSDIVCAGASILVSTCDRALCQLLDISPLEEGGKDGYARVLLPKGLTDAQRRGAQLLLAATRLGFQDLAEGYPDYFRLNTQRVDVGGC